MDNTKMPYLPEEVLRTQRVEVYLEDLKDRLKQLRQKHDEVILNSVEIIQEIDEVSSSLLSSHHTTTSTGTDESMTRIKKLIHEFETAKKTSAARLPIVVENRVNIQKILQNFEQLNQSHVLKESLVLFRKAKESFEKIDHIFGKLECLEECSNSNSNSNTNNIVEIRSLHINNSVRNKINMFNQRHSLTDTKSNGSNINSNELGKGSKTIEQNQKKKTHWEDINSNYASCCSSLVSLNKYHSVDNLLKRDPSILSTSLEKGYEGDNDDSEYNLLAIKRKKKQ